jgi:hypothetical protein
MAEKSLSPDRVVINWSAKSISFARQANFDDENREAIAEGYKAFERAFYKAMRTRSRECIPRTRSYFFLKLQSLAADTPSLRSGEPSLVPAATRSM